MQRLRIGIVGTHGVGKTTLAQELSERLGLPLIKEQVREVATELGIVDLNSMSYEQRLTLQQKVLERMEKKQAQYKTTGFVADRTVVDNLAYWLFYGLQRIYPDEFKHALDKVIKVAEDYDLVISVPIEFAVENDGFRFTCEWCRNTMDFIITELLLTVRLMCEKWWPIVVVSGSVENRVNTVLSVIEEVFRVEGK